jgi:hypothetical protein
MQSLRLRKLSLQDVCLFDPQTQRGTCEYSVLRNEVCTHGWSVYADMFGIGDPGQARCLWRQWLELTPTLPEWARGDPTAVWTPTRQTADPVQWPRGVSRKLADFAPDADVTLLSELPMPSGSQLLGTAGGVPPLRAPKQGGRRRQVVPPGGLPKQDPVRVPMSPVPDPHSLVSPGASKSDRVTIVGGRRLRHRSSRGMGLAMRELASASVARAKRSRITPPCPEADKEAEPPPDSPSKRRRRS